ncbi:MAG: vesicular-fusion protein S17 [Cyphobasidiales sp. Tagirdzhanova-0007]|nr:MAG: vesicular-fusion protein S17 [Cyphobasidiales sp. Tagirdzhanova-0007]
MSTAQSLLASADKKANSSSGFFSFGKSSDKFEEAHDLYQGAANAFKLESRWKESGDAFCKAAEMSIKAGEKDDAANDFWNASKSYKKSHPEREQAAVDVSLRSHLTLCLILAVSVASLKRTIEILLERGRFRQAADRESRLQTLTCDYIGLLVVVTEEIAQIYQQDGSDLQLAMDSYERAGEWYSSEDATATANAMFKESADLAAQIGNYPKAIQRYEQIANASLSSALTRFSVKEYYLKAGICHLCTGDVVSAHQAIEQYSQQDSNFGTTREYKFLKSITDAVDAGDAETFTGHVQEYDRLTHLDNWKTNMLLKVKKMIDSEEGGLS